jgi:hypothetical protein
VKEKALGLNLMISSDHISRNTMSMIEKFRNYSDNPAVSEKTITMLDNMERVRKITSNTIEYLDELKRNLKIEAGLRLVNMKETYNEDDFNVVTDIFKSKKKGIELYEHLIKYQTNILQINPDLYVALKSSYYFFDFFSMSQEKLARDFTNTYFDNINAISAMAVINKFENDVRLYENKAVSFFFTKVAIDLPVMAN